MLNLNTHRCKVTSIFLSTSSEKLQYFPINNSYLRALLDILRSTLPAGSKEKICRVKKVNWMVILFCKYTYEHTVLCKYDIKIQKSEKRIWFRCLILLRTDQKDFQKLLLQQKNLCITGLDLYTFPKASCLEWSLLVRGLWIIEACTMPSDLPGVWPFPLMKETKLYFFYLFPLLEMCILKLINFLKSILT